MFFERIYDEDLAQAAYIIGCAATEEALVVDPLRDIDQYLDRLEELDFQLTGVAETHIHAGFLSGGRDLARATGATLYISGETVENWEYDALTGIDVHRLGDGESFQVGDIHIEAMHTPGHTPEHISFVVTDTVQADEPMMALTGDFAFVGDLGRPDLLEKAAGESGTAERGARQQFESVRDKLVELPDSTQIWPGHGAGSACGKALGSIPASTVGYERRNSWWASYIEDGDVDGFVDELLAEQPESPTYFRQMKELNRDGMPEGDTGGWELPAIPELTPAGFQRAVEEQDAVVLDLKSDEAFAREHRTGSINLPSLENVATHAGWVAPYDRPLVLRVAREQLDQVRRGLYRIGFTNFTGWVPRLEGYTKDVTSYEMVDTDEAHQAVSAGHAVILDVRAASEYREGHIPEAIHIHYGRIDERAEELPRDKQLIVHCASGRRASIATGVLESLGFDDIAVFSGDAVARWREAGYPVE